MNTKEKEVVFVGIRVSKDTLDVYRPDTGEHIKIQNTEVDINGLCKVLKKKNEFVSMEATGTDHPHRAFIFSLDASLSPPVQRGIIREFAALNPESRV